MSERMVEHDLVVITRDVPGSDVYSGDVGVVLLVHEGSADRPPGYTIAITTVTGETTAVLDVPADHVRPVASTDERHIRPSNRIA